MRELVSKRNQRGEGKGTRGSEKKGKGIESRQRGEGRERRRKKLTLTRVQTHKEASRSEFPSSPSHQIRGSTDTNKCLFRKYTDVLC